ncbi:stage VI sporulation protein F [Salimicrobium halophilum]|uniref:Stage VI sporulation protein F n=1 Tax=Salimicrobium halophilum TaxID=86666 RepID=A0A1G8PZW6_9BACI|nr:stage VI sporulation protein F [Salimicrobium halophilum]SDI97987.1 Stage VI sporulation protein F [Salimicrobium halophilum]
MSEGIFDYLKNQANIDKSEIYQMVDAVQHADMNDEQTVRRIVRQLSRLANKRISSSKEDKIVEAIVKNQVPMDMKTLENYLK